MPTARVFGWNDLGFLPHASWGGGPESDGTDLFGDRVGGINADGDCFDPMVRRDRIEHGLERGEGATVIACLLALRGRPRKKFKQPAVVCPGHNGHDMHRVAAALGAEVVNLNGSPVLRRKRAA